MARYARRELTFAVPLDAFRPETLPAAPVDDFRIVDEHGRQLATGRNLAQLRPISASEPRAVPPSLRARIAGSETTAWDFGDSRR